MRATSAAVLVTVVCALVALLGLSGTQVQIGVLELEAEWNGANPTDPAYPHLDHPMGIAVDGSGRVLVADSGNARIVVFDADGLILATWPLPAGARPVGLAVHPSGTVLAADYTGDRILALNERGEIQEMWGKTGPGEGEFRAPSGVAVTASGTILVVEFMGQRIQELDADGGFLRFIDGGESGRRHAEARPTISGMEDMVRMQKMGGKGAGNPDGLFLFPSDAAVGPDGTLYISNTHAYEILVFAPDGELRNAWGTKGSEAGVWEVPVGMATDAAGNLFVADSANFRVQGIAPNGSPRLVSRANERWWLTTRRIYSPTDVAVGPAGRLYVADFAASKIQRFRVVFR